MGFSCGFDGGLVGVGQVITRLIRLEQIRPMHLKKNHKNHYIFH